MLILIGEGKEEIDNVNSKVWDTLRTLYWVPGSFRETWFSPDPRVSRNRASCAGLPLVAKVARVSDSTKSESHTSSVIRVQNDGTEYS